MRDYARLVSELRELKTMAAEIDAQIEAVKDEIKAGLMEQNRDVIVGKDFKISYKPVFSDRLDTKSLKHDLPEIAARYMKTTVSHRLVIS